MDKFVVTGTPAFNGDYPIDIGSFTMRELNIIKRMSGVRAGELEQAFQAGDSDLILAICVIAVRRNGRDWETFEKIAWDLPLDAIEFVGDRAEDDALPLTETLPASNGNDNGQPDPSGERSSDDGDTLPETTPLATGSPR